MFIRDTLLIRNNLYKKIVALILSLGASGAVACSLVPSNPLSGQSPPKGLNSFMGVKFGDSRDEVEHLFPIGFNQTSPYGAPAFKVEDVSAGSFDYQDVVYEFTDQSGMQMVIAHFPPSEGSEVYQQLESALGAPSSTGTIHEGVASLEASWKLPNGGRVQYSGPFHRVVLIGKEGASLEVDIRLRDLDAPVAARG